MALKKTLALQHCFALSIILSATFDATSGLRYNVGDSVWSIPPQPDFYNSWSSSHTFYIGDVLVFDFEYELFNVIQVPKLDYEGCSALNPIRILRKSPALSILTHEGVNYYICNISNYCDLGLKFSVVIHKLYYPSRHSPAPSPLLSLPPSLPPSAINLSPYSAPEPSHGGWTNVSQPSMPNGGPVAPNAGRRNRLSANSGRKVVALACALCLGIILFMQV